MRRTIEQLRLASLMGWQGEGDRIMVLSPDEAQAWLATSSLEGCLTHLVRYATAYGARSWLTFHAQCGQMVMRGHRVLFADEMFACARCIAVAEKYGEPTFGMIPTSGCEVSNGKRRGRPSTAQLRARSTRTPMIFNKEGTT